MNRVTRRLAVNDPLGPLVSAAFALLAILGVFLPWVEGYGWSGRGIEHSAGVITFAAALAGLTLCALRFPGKAGMRALALARVAVGSVLLGAPLWFAATSVGDLDPSGPLVSCFQRAGCPVFVAAGSGLYIDATAGLSFLVIALFDATASWRHGPAPPESLQAGTSAT
ncbi:MAG: hypothetical protein WEC75_13575 [Dehalococcoidia bacterium]